ncbi:MAG TPA: ComEA family DNA-binding protein [Actinobacteria bacterium]|nr:ComEA family DNA-binding protein [Actinomycetota bacterium]
MSELPFRRTAALAVGAAVVALGVGLWNTREAPGPAPVTVVDPVTDDPASITVHVTGAVAVPGVVRIPDGGRIVDVVAAAGGALPDADLAAVNLAAPVADGDRIHVPTLGEGDPVSESSGIDLNRADAAELEQLDGVGPVLARRIVEYRAAHGPFRTVEDLLDVPGIGEAKLAAIRPGIAAP